MGARIGTGRTVAERDLGAKVILIQPPPTQSMVTARKLFGALNGGVGVGYRCGRKNIDPDVASCKTVAGEKLVKCLGRISSLRYLSPRLATPYFSVVVLAYLVYHQYDFDWLM